MDEMDTNPPRRGRGPVRVAQLPRIDLTYVVAALFVGLLLTMTVLAVGCGGSAEGASGTTAVGSSGDGSATVRMVDYSFEPQTITVASGTTITWINEDSVSHNAVADDESWGTDIFGGGGSASITFDSPGTYPYNCTLHAGMVGTVVVE
jgi:plastocyanin